MVDIQTAEQLALQDVVAVETPRDLLLVSGADAGAYLQGQLSQNVEGLRASETTWTLLLQPQGKVDSWLRVHRLDGDRYLLDLDAGYGEQAVARLERFKLRVDVTIEPSTGTMLALRGPAAAAAAAHRQENVVALDASWAGMPGVDLVRLDALDSSSDSADSSDSVGSVGDGSEPSVQTWLATDVATGPPELLQVLRIRSGLPAMGSELDESTIPAAAGIVDQSVDFTKGCYVGQELVARVDSRGNNTPTRLYGVRFDGTEPPAAGTELAKDGAAAGTVTSVAVSPSLGPIGLAYLKRAVEVPVTLDVTDSAGRTWQASAVELPFVD